MIFKEIGNRKNVEVICHYFPFGIRKTCQDKNVSGSKSYLRDVGYNIFVGTYRPANWP